MSTHYITNMSIKNPKQYVMSNISEGENVVVHKIDDTDFLVTLKFEEAIDISELKYKPVLTFDKTINLRENSKLKIQFNEIQSKILESNSICLCYNYLFVISKQKLKLVSISFDNMPLTFTLINEIAGKLKIPVKLCSWTGPFSKQIFNIFPEDIFVQKV